MTYYIARPTHTQNKHMSASSELSSHPDDSPVLQVDLSAVVEEEGVVHQQDANEISFTQEHDHDTANNTSYDLGAATGMRGNAFAHIESVEVIPKKSRMKKSKDRPIENTGPKILLHPMTVLFPEGRVTAIMGPSASGKTTLLNFVTGAIGNGIKAKGQVSLSGQMGVVPHQDHLHGFYTCRWYMAHYTRLVGLEDNFANAKLCMDILTDLGMATHSDTRVGDAFYKGLNRGQRRRLSVALEALSSPETLFCDEPTSDLDSESAYQIMKFLKTYSRATGRRVVVTLHEPASFLWQFIDHVVLLSEGKLMYQGPRMDIESFFAQNGCPCPEKFNPADHYLACVSPEFHINEKTPDDWSNAYHAWEKTGGISNDIEYALSCSHSFPPSPPSPLGSKKLLRVGSKPRLNEIVTTIQPKPSSRATVIRAMFELIRRQLWSLWLNPGILGVRVILCSALSLFLGIFFWNLEDRDSYSSAQSRIALLFYAVTFYIFLSIASVPFAFLERGRVEKEVRNGYYHPAAFHLAHILTSIPAMSFLSLVATFVLLSMTKLRAPVSFFFNLFLTLMCAEGSNQLISYLLPHFIVAAGILSALYSGGALLMGFMVVPSEFPAWMGWTRYLAFHTYSWRTLMVKEFGRDGQTERVFASENIMMTGRQILEEYELEYVYPITDMFILLGLAIIINLAAFIVLHVKHVSHKSHQVVTDM